MTAVSAGYQLLVPWLISTHQSPVMPVAKSNTLAADCSSAKQTNTLQTPLFPCHRAWRRLQTRNVPCSTSTRQATRNHDGTAANQTTYKGHSTNQKSHHPAEGSAAVGSPVPHSTCSARCDGLQHMPCQYVYLQSITPSTLWAPLQPCRCLIHGRILLLQAQCNTPLARQVYRGRATQCTTCRSAVN